MNILSYLAGRYGDRYPGHDLPAYLMGKAAGSAAVVWKTVSGALVHITDAMARPAKSLIVKIEPVQEGSGDPSPTNVRPISGHTGVNISHSGADMTNPDIIPVSWETEAGTVYGGELDVVSGKLTVDRAMVDLGDLSWGTMSGNRFRVIDLPNGKISEYYGQEVLCSCYGTRTSNPRSMNDYEYCCGSIYYNNSVCWLVIKDSRYSSASDFKTAMDGQQLVYELAEPIEYTLTAQEVKTYLGQNNIWNDVGETEITYAAR